MCQCRSKFCFVVVVVDLLLLGVTVIALNTATKLQRFLAAFPGSLAWQSCPAAWPGSLAWPPCLHK
jgi:hypothetical protein